MDDMNRFAQTDELYIQNDDQININNKKKQDKFNIQE
jgi:hypothetical protein